MVNEKLGVIEAARVLNRHPESVRRYLRLGKLKGEGKFTREDVAGLSRGSPAV